MRSHSGSTWPLLIAATPRWSQSLLAEAMRFGWLLADQGVFAATNFIANVLFARWLSPIDYGLFAVSFSGYLLLTVVHFGAILEPLLVQSAKVEPERMRSYIVVLIEAHLIMMLGISLLAALSFLIALSLGHPTIGWAIVGASVGGWLMASLLTARRLCLVFLSTRLSASIGIVYMAGVVITTYLLHFFDHVSWFDMWLVMGGWSLVCSCAIFLLLYFALSGTAPYTFGELCRFQWQYARYGLAAAICSWFRVDGVLLLLAHFAGLATIAETRAVLNLANPAIQVNMALYTSWLVVFSRHPNFVQLRRIATIYVLVASIGLAITYAIASPLVQWAYHGRYLDGAWLLPLYGIAVALNGTEAVFTCFLKAAHHLRRGYTPQIVGAIISMMLGYWLVPTHAEVGAVGAVVISFGLGTILAVILALSAIAERRGT
jgi:O-antigen/teichoic acid export membrane protein